MFLFKWEVWKEGYQWVQTPCGRWLEEPHPPEPQWLLTTGKPARTPGKLWQYLPLRHTGLFRAFAETPRTREGMLTFANRYGMLTGGEDDAYYYLPSPEKPGTDFEYIGERETFWAQEIEAMWQAVHLWELIQGENRKELARYVKWEGGGQVYYEVPKQGVHKSASPGARIADSLHHPDRLAWLTPGDVLMPAQCRIQDIINKHQTGRVSPQLVWNAEHDKLIQYFIPNNLLGALWLQCALAIDSNKRYVRCNHCQTWFAVATKGTQTDKRNTRADKRFCTNICRQRAFRSRKDGRKYTERDCSI